MPFMHNNSAFGLKKRDPSWRGLRLVSQLPYLPGLLILAAAAFSLLSYLSAFSHPRFSYNVQAHSFSSHYRVTPPLSAQVATEQHNSKPVALTSSSLRAPPAAKPAPPPPARVFSNAPAGSSKRTQEVEPPRVARASQQQRPMRSCKWSKYADWPYTNDLPRLNPLRRKLVYVKNPKTSSSTVAHILQRYTSRNGMKVAYPDFARNIFTLNDETHAVTAKRLAGVPAHANLDAIVSHMVYNSTWVHALLGTARPFRITSVRDPVPHAWSMYLHGSSRNMTAFTFGARDPWTFARRMHINPQSAYISGFGISFPIADARAAAAHFDHMIVSGRVVESIVTLAPKLGLRASDLLFFSQKASGIHGPATISKQQKASVDALLRSRTRVDARLFKDAGRRLDTELAQLPPKIRRILQDIPAMRREVTAVCGAINAEDNSCLSEGEIVWDGNAVCVARCIARWADKHINCL